MSTETTTTLYRPVGLAELELLRDRGVRAKRSLAIREGLEHFIRRDPLRHMHECVFAVLALESEPVDPRL